jgi:hypothetical protein
MDLMAKTFFLQVSNDLEGLDLPGLQRKLNDLILSSRRASESDIVSIC